MSIPLADMKDRSPAELPVNVPVLIRFDRVLVRRRSDQADVEISGPVDFGLYDTTVYQLTDPATGTSKTVPGVGLHVVERDGVAQDKYLNVVAKRLVAALRPYLEAGSYMKLRFSITKIGERPSSTFSVAPVPVT